MNNLTRLSVILQIFDPVSELSERWVKWNKELKFDWVKSNFPVSSNFLVHDGTQSVDLQLIFAVPSSIV